MKTYNLEFTPKTETTNGRKWEVYSFTTEQGKWNCIYDARSALMNEAFHYFRWYGEYFLKKYGTSYRQNWDDELSYQDFVKIAEDNGFIMKFYEEF